MKNPEELQKVRHSRSEYLHSEENAHGKGRDNEIDRTNQSEAVHAEPGDSGASVPGERQDGEGVVPRQRDCGRDVLRAPAESPGSGDCGRTAVVSACVSAARRDTDHGGRKDISLPEEASPEQLAAVIGALKSC